MNTILLSIKMLTTNHYFKVISGIITILIIFFSTIYLNFYLEKINVHNLIFNLFNLFSISSVLFMIVIMNKKWNAYSVKQIGFNLSKIPAGLIFGFSIYLVFIAVILLISYLYIGEGSLYFYNVFQIYSNKVIELIIFFLIVGLWEEAVFRGYLLVSLMKKNKIIVSILISSVFFSLIHLTFMGWSWGWGINILLYSIFISYVYLYTSNLWIPIFFHWIWNCINAFFKDDIGMYGVIYISPSYYESFTNLVPFGLLTLIIIFYLISLKFKPHFPFE